MRPAIEQEMMRVLSMFLRQRFLVVAGLSVCALAASTGIVSAHAQYQSSTPAANSTLAAAPNAVQVSWTQEIRAIQFTITAPDGSNVASGPATLDLEQRHTASVPMRAAGPGQYLVLWHNVSDEDGDPNDGSFVFTVAGPAPVTPTPTPSGAPGGATTAVPVPPAAAVAARATPTATTSTPACVDTGQTTPGQADFRVNTYCKRQAIRDQYRGKINELVFNFDLSIGMGLENSLKDAMGQGPAS